jgi:uncharacterized protein HemY
MGKLILIVGLIIAGIGLLIMAGLPLGRLPGDYVVRRGSLSFYFPLATSLLVSVILTLLLMWLRR